MAIFLLGIALATSVFAFEFEKSELKAIGLIPDTGENMTPLIRKAIDRLKREGGGKLVLEPGRYDFWPEGASEEFLYVSNNDSGVNWKVFDLSEVENIEIDGQGAELIMHGKVSPFVVRGSRSIAIKNLAIDWEVPFHSEGDVVAVDPDGRYMDLRILEGFSYRVEDGCFYHTGSGVDNVGVKVLLEYNVERKESEFQAPDNWLGRGSCKAEELEPGLVRFSPKNGVKKPYPIVGNRMLVMQVERYCSAIFIDASEDIEMENIAIYHSGSMGVIGQLSGNISLRGVKVIPREGSSRMVSTQVDATHFVNCYGDIVYEDCRFSNHIDDAINVHGTYTPIREIVSDRSVTVERVHFQQVGVQWFRPGDRVSLTYSETMNIYHEGVVEKVEPIDAKLMTVTFKEPLPQSMRLGDVLDNETTQPNVVMRGCYVGKNRARGTLFKIKGKVLIEDNVFHSSGSAIQIRGGVDGWYESGPVCDITIRKNRFENCKYGVWGDSVIDILTVVPRGSKTKSEEPYHKNILIENNLFETFDGYIVHAFRAADIRFENNTIRKTETYPNFREVRNPVGLLHAPGFSESGNRVEGFEFEAIAGGLIKSD